MRLYIVILAFSMCAWVAVAAVSGVGNSRINHDGGHEAKVETVDGTGAPDLTTDDAATEPSATTAEPSMSDVIANGGQPLGPPPGPKTLAEEKADSVLSCMEACGADAVVCLNSCITTGYNVPSGPVPSVTASIPPPLSTVTPATAPVAATTTGTTPKAQGSGAMSISSSYGMGCAVVVVVAIASFFAVL